MWWFKPAKDVLESHIGGALILTKYIKGMADKIEKRTASFETCAKRPMQDCFHSCIWRILIKWSKVQSCETWYNKSHLARINIQKQEQRQTTFWVTIDLMWQTKESKRNHQESTKKRWRITKTSFAQMEGKCYCCRKGCHKSPQCHHKNRPKEEWAINKAKSEELSLFQIGNITTDTNSAKNNNESTRTTFQFVTNWWDEKMDPAGQSIHLDNLLQSQHGSQHPRYQWSIGPTY